jgi:hypothetical protein
VRATILLTVLLLAGCTGDDSGDESEEESAVPATTKCARSLGAVEVDGDVLVPRGKTCRMDGTTISGRVTVSSGATLVARDAHFEEGISAHLFDRVELRGGSGGGPTWGADIVLDGGRDVVLRDAPVHSDYYLIGNTGRVEIVGLSLIEGSVYCADNTHRPTVRGVSAESPGVLQGQCAGLENFGESDF